MTTRPDLVGGSPATDTQLMQADARVVAKRGAEAVFGAGVASRDGPVGVAVKITDGGVRADAPVVAHVLTALGCTVPPDIARPPVLGGGRVQGELLVDPAVGAAASALG
jgi:L-asparaginase II